MALNSLVSKRFIIALRCGRLGNRLTLFANIIGFAAEHHHRVINFSFHSYAHLFETTRRDIYCQFPASTHRSRLDAIPVVARAIRSTRLLYHGVRAANWLTQRLPGLCRGVVTLRELPGREVTLLESPGVEEQISNATTVFVHGWNFRAPQCVERHAQEIREFFRPTAEHTELANRVLENLRQTGDVVVGVHLRHGDYRNWRGGKYFFPVSRYVAWMRQFAEQARKVSFLVCSDEPRSREEFPGLNVAIGTPSPLADLYALSRCDYIIGPVSSFTQWASFYGATPLFSLTSSDVVLDREQFRISYLGEIPR